VRIEGTVEATGLSSRFCWNIDQSDIYGDKAFGPPTIPNLSLSHPPQGTRANRGDLEGGERVRDLG
jgi:hypothetical protein